MNIKKGHFYIDPNLKDYFYYCESIEKNIVNWILLESYQHGNLIQVRFTAKPEGLNHYVELKNQREIKRLNLMLKKFKEMEKENKFKKMLEDIDEEFKKQGIPIFQRPIHAIREVCIKKNIRLSFTPKGHAIPGNYEGDSLVVHIHNWFENKYGDRLKINFSPGSVAVMIKGDAWKINSPLFFGTARFVFDPELEKYKDEPKIQKNVPCMIVNPLKFIDGFTSEYARTMTKNEMIELKDEMLICLEALQLLSEIKLKPYIPEAKADLNSAVSNIFSNPPHYGQSKWASLQFTEKLFKCFLELKNVKFPKKHDLELLSNLSVQNGLNDIPKNDIQNIQCAAGVRYGEIIVSQDEAIKAHQSYLKICAIVSLAIKAI